jgi:hypothetical protein
VQAGWRYLPVPEERPILERDQRLVVRISAPADEITSCLISEIQRSPLGGLGRSLGSHGKHPRDEACRRAVC